MMRGGDYGKGDCHPGEGRGILAGRRAGKGRRRGGGTIAKYVAHMDVDTVDLGVPILSMHSPFELASKLDVWNTYRAFKAFYQ